MIGTIYCLAGAVGNFPRRGFVLDLILINLSRSILEEFPYFHFVTCYRSASINASFTYSYSGDEAAETTGQYSLSARVSTDLWRKNYVIVPKSDFSSNNRTASFSFDFPFNTTFYENVLDEIFDEIGIEASNPTLDVICDVTVSSQTSKGSISETFTHSINISLDGNIIEFGEGLLQSDAGILTGEEEVFLQDVVDNRDMWSASSIFFILILVGFVLVTKNGIEKYDKTEKRINKIKKKYGDWIVEVEKSPKGALGSETIIVKSLEDLIKTSEELGKPVIYYLDAKKHNFYILDESIQYQYILE